MKHAKLRSFTFILVAFMLGCNEFMVVGVLSDIARSYHVPLSTVGFLVTAFAGVYAISTPIITTLTSNWNRYKLLMLLMTVFFIGNTLTAIAPTLGWLLFARIITAAVAGTIISLINLLVSIITPMDKRPMVLAWVGAGFSIASVIGVPLGTTIATLLSWHDSFWIISGLTLIVFALLAWLTPRDTPQVKGSILEQLALLRDHRVLLGIGITVAVLSLQYTFYTYVRPLITTVMGFSLTSLNWLLLLLGVMSIIGNEIAGIVASHNGVQKLPIVFILMTILSFVLGIALGNKITGMLVLAALCVVVIIYGTTIQLVFISVAEKEYPQSLALATSLISIFANVGISLGSFTASTTVNFANLTTLGYVGAVYGLLAIGLSFALRRFYRK
ncbi:MFS transporter [Limosilactobacillus reuteri]|uniref:MFS transporter n=1 Tax=Limosilactobacillus reuteri TaxID=1598 RepID=UPI001E6086B6|nr:MFS transporter [Limosilactobacillus reuteri]MCC4339830.1 MFS transporter [Limosilactobacillus reuteri]MCC4346741.1 MFS transporter [Limosilactobacillus reuteri]MCC4349991.1 MFS transporter [Limosilactobacillus reuteri]MCC4359865.1 MFS transporter [Limosilactobacillus reuteri]MCC4365773.1 MFS transporter [Limosilactobacillus reuteri]